jgi:Lon protease-like protein
MSQDEPSAEEFGGAARLFPLPDLVMFPHVVQPLHVFEQRYRQLMADALEDDRLIAMALLRPGWEEKYHERPAIHPVVCVGQIQHEQRLPDGRYNLVLHGLWRARVLREPPPSRLYRVARVEVLPDEPVEEEARAAALQQQMTDRVRPYFAGDPPAHERLDRLLERGLPLGTLCDIFSFALPLGVEVKQELLEELRVENRVRLLLRSLDAHAPPDPAPAAGTPRRFPPGFSAN